MLGVYGMYVRVCLICQPFVVSLLDFINNKLWPNKNNFPRTFALLRLEKSELQFEIQSGL